MGRTGVQSDHGSGVHHAHAFHGIGRGRPHSAHCRGHPPPAIGRRLLANVLRCAGRPQHIHRVLLCTEARRRLCRSFSHGKGPRVYLGQWWRSQGAGIYQDMAGPLRSVGLEGNASHAARPAAAAQVGPLQHLPLCQLGAGNHRANDHHSDSPPYPASAGKRLGDGTLPGWPGEFFPVPLASKALFLKGRIPGPGQGCAILPQASLCAWQEKSDEGCR